MLKLHNLFCETATFRKVTQISKQIKSSQFYWVVCIWLFAIKLVTVMYNQYGFAIQFCYLALIIIILFTENRPASGYVRVSFDIEMSKTIWRTPLALCVPMQINLATPPVFHSNIDLQRFT